MRRSIKIRMRILTCMYFRSSIKDEYDLDEDLNGDDVEMYLRQHVGLNQVTSV